MNRRHFLRNGTCGMMSSIPALNTVLNMTLANNLASAQAPSPSDPYKALICLFFTGGNDSFNMLVPTTPGEYSTYSATRSSVGIPLASLLPITTNNTPGRTFGLHPSMPDIANLFNQGNASLVANIGTLVEPIPNVAAYNSGLFKTPVAQGGHNSAQTQWQTGLPQLVSNRTGWLGRTADIINSRENPASLLPMSFALSNAKTVNQGETGSGLIFGSTGINLLDNGANRDKWLKDRFEAQRANVYQNILQRVHRDKMTEYSDLSETFQNQFQTTNTTTAFSAGLSASFRAIARTISLRNVFNVKRQTFFINFGNWDGHSDLIANQAALLAEVNLAIKEFWAEMVAQGLQDKVTVFTGSDFGRTLRSNGDGTDHAWGGNAFVIGGALNGSSTATGSKILGNYPTSLGLGTGLDIGTNGRLLPTTSVDSYYADLLLWFGVARSELPQVLPNIARFYSSTAAGPPLGLFA